MLHRFLKIYFCEGLQGLCERADEGEKEGYLP
jgi:hypothetical protein